MSPGAQRMRFSEPGLLTFRRSESPAGPVQIPSIRPIPRDSDSAGRGTFLPGSQVTLMLLQGLRVNSTALRHELRTRTATLVSVATVPVCTPDTIVDHHAASD